MYKYSIVRKKIKDAENNGKLLYYTAKNFFDLFISPVSEFFYTQICMPGRCL